MVAQAVITAADKTGNIFNRIAGKMRGLDHQAKAVNRSMAAQGTILAGVGRALAPIITPVAIGYGVKKLADNSLSLEKTMIEVGKATNTSGDELKTYEKAILDLARATGQSKEEIGSMLAAAGFAGRPTQDLVRFTEYAAKATTAWGTSAEETGQALAELANTYKAGQSRLEEIGDAINYVADNAAAREADLIQFVRDSGAAGDQAGLSAEQTIAFGAALKEVGMRTEVASSTFNSLVNAMALGDKFLDSSKEGYAALGLSAAKVQKEFAKKPLETTVKLLERLAKIKDPIKAAEIRTALFGKEYQDNVAILSNNLVGLSKALGLVSDKGRYAGSVMENFNNAIDSDVGRISKATQALDVLMTRSGRAFKEAAGGLAIEINKLVEASERGDGFFDRLEARRKAYNRERYGSDDPPIMDGDPGGILIQQQVQKDLENSDLWKKSIFDTSETKASAEEAGRQRAIAERTAEQEAVISRMNSLLEESRRLGGIDQSKLRFKDDTLTGAVAENARRLSLAQEDARRIEQGRYAGGRPTYPWAGDDSDARISRDLRFPLTAPMPPERPIDVTGKVELDPSSKVDVNVKISVEGDGRVTSMSASSGGNAQGNVGTSMPHIKAGPR